MRSLYRGLLALLTTSSILAGCGSATSGGGPAGSVIPDRSPVSSNVSKIKHIVVIIQENRSFDNIFAGYPNALTATSGLMHDGRQVTLHPINFRGKDICHSYACGRNSYDGGKMDGFDLNPAGGGTYPYAYLVRALVKPYWDLASQYVLADHFFPTEFGPSYTAHLDLIAGTSNLSPTQAIADVPSAVPWSCYAPPGTVTWTISKGYYAKTTQNGPFPCFTQFNTIADTLDAAHVSWKYYCFNNPNLGGKIWTPFASIQKIRSSADWNNNIVTPPSLALTDPQTGKLPQVAFVTPYAPDSDHPGTNSDTGPSWVANVVNSIGKSPYWDSTAIVITWDEWGGWYDNAVPPQLDYRGLGERAPLIVVSPYTKPGVSHTQFEYGSILKFIEQTFGLPPLGPASAGYTDTRANSIAEALDLTMRPRAYHVIPVKYPPSHFLNEPNSDELPDDY